jgi:uncharacterized protein DUF6636
MAAAPRRTSSGLRLVLLAAAALLAILALPAQASAFIGFHSPSGNIGCVMDKSGVRCDIRNHDWPTPPKPKNCELDYGGGVFVGKHHRASFICAGDTTLGSGHALPYGQSKSLGRFRCVSLESGMRCKNRGNGHGFFLSREKVRLY